jgi:predicted small metal-binding protein
MLIKYAERNGFLVHVEDVPNGLQCGCICPACGQQLIAKNKGEIKDHHFAHFGDLNCKYAYQSTLHLMAKEIFTEVESIKLPVISYELDEFLSVTLNSKPIIEIERVILEKKLNSVIPDIILTSKNGSILLIEIKVTHGIDSIKQNKLEELNLDCIEVDLEDCLISTKEDLKEILMNDFSRWRWINVKDKGKTVQQIKEATETINLNNIGEDKITEYCPENKSTYGIKPQTCANVFKDCKKCPFNLGISIFEDKIQCAGRLKITGAEEFFKISSSTKIGNQIQKVLINKKEVYFDELSILKSGTIKELWNGKTILVKNVITRKAFKISKNPNITIEKYGKVYGTIYKDGHEIKTNTEIYYHNHNQWVLIPRKSKHMN